jgi:hypothetical protein
MADIEKAVATQLSNIQKRTGRSLTEVIAWMRSAYQAAR